VGGRARTSYPVRRLFRAVALGTAVAALALGVSATAATASPKDDLAGATAQATKLEKQIAANSARADVLDEQYLQAQNAAAAAVKRIAATQHDIAVTDASAARLRNQLGGRAALLYMGVGNSDPLDIDASSVTELGSKTKYGEAAAAQDMRVLHVLQATDDQLKSQHDDLAGQLAAAQDQERAEKTAQQEVARVNASMQKLLDSTNVHIKTLATQIAQQAAAAAAVAERARIAAQQAAARAAAARRAHDNQGHKGGTTSTTNPGDPGNGDMGPPADLPAPSRGAAAAVAYAYAQIGKPYVYAGAGPDSFDCSGLTMMAWLQGGVSMEHGSQAQYDAFPHVPLDQLEPGDLVFFGDSGPTNHHVGIVVGPGMMIDAPHTGAFVELVSYYWPDLVALGARP
jgi:peptidoglycan DL-endopeptidase CwlO